MLVKMVKLSPVIDDIMRRTMRGEKYAILHSLEITTNQLH